MTKLHWAMRPLLAGIVLAMAAPGAAQSAGDSAGDVRLRKLEAEVAALQRQVFPGGDGKYFAPLVQPGQAVSTTTGTPATTPVTDLLVRMDAIEAQLARITAQNEETQNKLAQFEARLAALSAAAASSPTTAGPPAPAATTPATGATVGATTATNLTAMTGGASATKPATPAATKPATATPATTPAKPSAAAADRVAAVKAVQKPATADAGDDEYTYGFRLWEARFYPEAQQQLKLYLQKYPRHGRSSHARNLLGRTYLDEGNPREAASWFLQNYQAGKTGDRAPDSLLFLAEAMGRLKDTNRACVALAQFVDDYPREATGRLKTQYDATRAKVKCN
ncbi:tol-pal system YbgF family protein [Novosphingobium sp.]|uniref:tetratricopeptide repeat protein n=1 Tax=Novosphingobium sp. TaxID=1874826 RepID=UPI002736078C|nr:hypothetical protein [Novosphingobium sp.]MDP3907878.1 hypothetical protein [Novosphingobium sp.]